MEFATLGGLERIAIVAGAIIIGYWGYRLYTAEKNAGLAFMGLSVVVLIGALMTGSDYARSVGESQQLASIPAGIPASTEAPAPPAPVAEPATDVVLETSVNPVEPSPFNDEQALPEPAAEIAEAEVPADPEPIAEPASTAAPDLDLAVAPEPAAVEADAETDARLATGAELGGRIMSVKSENVSLEWAPDA